MITCIYDYILKKKCLKCLILMYEIACYQVSQLMTKKIRMVVENTWIRIKINTKLINLVKYHQLDSIEVNKGRIYRELRYFLGII